MAAKAEAASEDLCDFLTAKLRDRLLMETGYSSDVLTQSRKLSKVLRLHAEGDASGSTMDFEEFHKAMLRLNFVGQQRGLEALYRRYDLDGSGRIHIETFVSLACRMMPDAQSAPPIRVAFNNIRTALKAAAGPFGVQVFINHLQANYGTTLPVAAFKAALKELGAKIREQDQATALKELDIQGKGSVELVDVAFNLRGKLSRFRRELIDRVWHAHFGGEEASPSLEAVVTAAASADFAGVVAQAFGGAVLSSLGHVLYNEWVALLKSLSSVIATDSEFAEVLRDGFGVDTHVEKGAVILSGTLYDGLHQTLKAAALGETAGPASAGAGGRAFSSR